MWHQIHRPRLSVLVSIRTGGCCTWRCRAGQVEDVFLIDALVAEIKSPPAFGFSSSVMMTSCCQVALFLSLVVAVSVYAGNWCSTFYHLNLNIYGQNLKCYVSRVPDRHETGMYVWLCDTGVDRKQTPGWHVTLSSGYLLSHQRDAEGGRLQCLLQWLQLQAIGD